MPLELTDLTHDIETPGLASSKQSQQTPGASTGSRPSCQATVADPVDIEFAGWMPIFQIFGHCGTHPQFGHTNEPPSGYRFVCARKPENPFTDAPKAEASWLL